MSKSSGTGHANGAGERDNIIQRLVFRVEGYGEGEPPPAIPQASPPMPEWHAEFPDRHLLLALEQMGGPVWSVIHHGEHGQHRMSCSDVPPIGMKLADAIDRWFDGYLDWITDDHLNPKMNPDFPFAEFNGRGEALAKRCRAVLGPDWTVTFYPAEPIPPEVS